MSAPRRYPGWSKTVASWLAFANLLAGPLAAQARAPRVAIILDRESSRFRPLVDTFQREVLGFFRPGEITLLPPMVGDGTADGIRRVLDRALHDSTVSVVVTLGTIGSHMLARAGEPPKPAIAAVVIDGSWQGIPQRDDASGVHRLT